MELAKSCIKRVEEHLSRIFISPAVDYQDIYQQMHYCVCGGGKRLRAHIRR